MTDNQAIFETLFNRNFSDPGNLDFLNGITAKHPYFSPAQFFLLQQIPRGADTYNIQAAKTNILFNNAYWLNFQLQQTDVAEPAQAFIATEEMNPVNQEPETKINDHIADVTETGVETELPETVAENILPVETGTESLAPEPAMDLADDTDVTEETAMEPEIEPMKIELKMPQENTNLDEAMLFEPMHIVDYFASQGIKLTDEVQMADKLGKQLKSFTEWLKTMKKVHVETEVETGAEANTSIQTLAENSNAEAQVLTEAMAEVFAKQGKMHKAGEVYQKLSLLNPAKSAYFAAKIENLKEI